VRELLARTLGDAGRRVAFAEFNLRKVLLVKHGAADDALDENK
jgi:hypothetical protein